ncbi:C-X-C motif chemokine 10-like [Genypterus blacodes]|uniref:C-X-C motif chemokine 10-like n=1 Tax=Genypterus blacodes TaxID=154954 RepID=UPI003F77789D
MKSALIIACLTCLLVLSVQGQLTTGSDKCNCLNGFYKVRSLKLIKTEVTIHKPTAFCPNTEIIVITTTDNQRRCVNPGSPLGRILLKRS